MRRWLILLLIVAGMVPVMRARAEAITPADARARAADAEQTLVELNNYIVDGYFHHGEFEHAAAVLNRIITLNPYNPDAYATAAWLLWSAKKTDEATVFITRMLAANPDDTMANFEAGVFYMRLQNDAEAVKWFEKAVKLKLPSPQRHLYGLTLARLGRTAEALAFWQQVLAEEPQNEIARQQARKLAATETPPAPPPDGAKQ